MQWYVKNGVGGKYPWHKYTISTFEDRLFGLSLTAEMHGGTVTVISEYEIHYAQPMPDLGPDVVGIRVFKHFPEGVDPNA